MNTKAAILLFMILAITVIVLKLVVNFVIMLITEHCWVLFTTQGKIIGTN
jgi:hypothetical protein